MSNRLITELKSIDADVLADNPSIIEAIKALRDYENNLAFYRGQYLKTERENRRLDRERTLLRNGIGKPLVLAHSSEITTIGDYQAVSRRG